MVGLGYSATTYAAQLARENPGEPRLLEEDGVLFSIRGNNPGDPLLFCMKTGSTPQELAYSIENCYNPQRWSGDANPDETW